MKVKSESEVASVVSDSLQPHRQYPAMLLCPWGFPGKDTGVGCHSFSRGSSRPRDWTRVSCTAGRLFTIWATYIWISIYLSIYMYNWMCTYIKLNYCAVQQKLTQHCKPTRLQLNFKEWTFCWQMLTHDTNWRQVKCLKSILLFITQQGPCGQNA